MVNSAEWFKDSASSRISRSIAFTIYKNLSSKIVTKLDNNLSISGKLVKNETIKAFKDNIIQTHSSRCSLNNAVGRWNGFITFLLSETVLDITQGTEACITIFSLPNSQNCKGGEHLQNF